MNIVNLANKYLNRNGLEIDKGTGNNIVLPFIMMDLVREQYDKVIKPVNRMGKFNQMKKIWLKEYNALNQRFFRTFTQDEQDYFVEEMDDYEEFMNHHVMILKYQVQACMMNDSKEAREIMSACMISRIITLMAKSTWKLNLNEFADIDNILHSFDRITKACTELLVMSHDSKSVINFDASEELTKAMRVIAYKSAEWLKKH